MSDGRAVVLPESGRIMGIDAGTARIGVALSDGLRLAAHPHTVVDATSGSAFEEIADVATEHGVVAVVVGLPTSLDGSESQMAKRSRDMAEAIAARTGLPTLLYDERFTSKVAERALLKADISRRRRKQTIDKVAAAVMLQGYLDYSRSANE